ncbi:MAG: hypothetical protein ACP5OX_01790 [Minisyncoccia bacterium]
MANIDLGSLKQTNLPPTWPRGLFVFSLVIFLIVLIVFLALNYFWIVRQEQILNELQKKFQQIRSEFPLEKEEEVVLFEKRLNLLKSLLNQHPYFSKALLKLEEITHPQVYYTNFEYERISNTLTIQGVAKDQFIFSEAINGLVNHPEVIQVLVVKEMKTSADKSVTFSIDLVLNPNILKF